MATHILLIRGYGYNVLRTNTIKSFRLFSWEENKCVFKDVELLMNLIIKSPNKSEYVPTIHHSFNDHITNAIRIAKL